MNPRDAAVADAGPLIHLDELSRLSVLECYQHVWVPCTVFNEADLHRRGWSERCPSNVERVTVGMPEIRAFLNEFGGDLDAGEVETLAFWRQRHSASILCDDFAAREAARRMGASVIGTVGLLIKAAHQGRMGATEAVDLIRSIPRLTTLHIRSNLLDAAAKDLEHAFHLPI